MATATAHQGTVASRPVRAPLVLIVLALLAFAYIPFLFAVFMYPATRDLGFGTLDEIRNKSVLYVALILMLSVYFWHKGTPSPQARAESTKTGQGSVSAPPSNAPRVVRVAAEDPSARPGAPPAYNLPASAPDELQGGWQRYKFPAERTGGVYIDVDVRLDDLTRPRTDEGTPRGLYILRVRDEVARVCAQCDLINHCHGKVAALVTMEDMRGNFQCVPGLKKMVNAKIESMKKPKEQPPTRCVEVAALPVPAVQEGPAPSPV